MWLCGVSECIAPAGRAPREDDTFFCHFRTAMELIERYLAYVLTDLTRSFGVRIVDINIASESGTESNVTKFLFCHIYRNVHSIYVNIEAYMQLYNSYR